MNKVRATFTFVDGERMYVDIPEGDVTVSSQAHENEYTAKRLRWQMQRGEQWFFFGENRAVNLHRVIGVEIGPIPDES